MASTGNSNQQPPPFDLQNLFKTPNPSQNPINLHSSPYHVPSSFPPPQNSGFNHHYQYHHHHHLPPPLKLYSQEHHFLHENHGSRLMALLTGGQQSNNLDLLSVLPQAPLPVVSEFSGVPSAPNGNPEIAWLDLRTTSSKIPTGRHLVGENVVYDIDERLEGEVQPQLEVTPITKYGSDPQLVLGRQIAVNKSYVCYGLKPGNIRVLNITNALRSLLRGHSQRVTDMAFFAEDVHLLASVSIDGKVYVWKISEGQDEEDNPQIIGKIVIAIQIVGGGESLHPRICWHCHKQEVLVVGIGKCVLRIDTTKIGKGEVFSEEDPLKIFVDKLIDGIHLVGKHDGEVTDLSMCQSMTTRLVSASMDGTIKIWDDRKALPLVILRAHEGQPVNSAMFLAAPNRPDHIVLITAGPLNREVKIWALASEEGWLLPSDAESWKCTQTLELKSSAEPRVKEAFFNQAIALSQAGLLLLANAKKNAIYAVHIEYGPNPTASIMDYIAEFTVTMPILSFTGLHHREHIVQVYCVQTQAVQQYALDLSQCVPLPIEEKSEFSVSSDAPSAEGFASLDMCRGKPNDLPLAGPAMKQNVQVSSSDSACELRYPVTTALIEVAASENLTMESKPTTLTPTTTDAENVSVGAPPLPLSSSLSQKLSGIRRSTNDFDPASQVIDRGEEQLFNGYSVDLQVDTIQEKLSDMTSIDGHSKSHEKNVALDTVLNPSITFKHPTHLITPTEILIATSSSKTANVIEGKSEGEASIQEVVVSHEVGSAEVEVKLVGQTGFPQNDELFPQGESENFVSDNTDKFFCSQASDLDNKMAKECCAISAETSKTEEAWQADEEIHELRKDFAENIESTTLSTVAQSTTPHTKGKKQKGKNSEASGLSSLFPIVLNYSSNEPGGSSNLPSQAALRQIQSMQDKLNQLITMQKEMQKQMTNMVAVPVTKEGRRIEAALGRSMEKAIKANIDALWIRFQEENSKNERILQDRTQQIINVVTSFFNKDLPAILDKTVKKEITAVGNAVGSTISSTIEKTIPTIVAESFQRGVGDKAVNQLDKSVNIKLEATVARQIQAQFQTSGKRAIQDALKSSLGASLIPAFEMSCKAMFEQVDATFQKGITEHTTAVLQRCDSAHSSLALALKEVINSASSVVQTLSGELADGQRNLLALAAAQANPISVNSQVTQLTNGPLCGLHKKVETPLDPTKELLRLISEQKYEEAFTGALQRSDVSIVSWLCSQVDLQGILTTVPQPLSQGVVLSLLQQLACNINQDTSRKLTWMTYIATAINPVDSMIALHVRPIFEQVYQILSHHRSLPTNTGAELSNICILQHVINSMLVTCK